MSPVDELLQFLNYHPITEQFYNLVAQRKHQQIMRYIDICYYKRQEQPSH